MILKDRTVVKRDGTEVSFDSKKIYNAILKAMKNGSHKVNIAIASAIELDAIEHFEDECTIEEIENFVYKKLIEYEDIDTARHYVEYKAVRTSIRQYKNNVFDQMQNIMDLNSEDIRDNANKSGDKLTSLRAMFSDVACKEFTKERIVKKELEEEQEKLIYEHDRNYRNIPFSNCCLCNYSEMMKNGFHVGTTYIHDIKSITTAIAILSQIIAHVSGAQYGLKYLPY